MLLGFAAGLSKKEIAAALAVTASYLPMWARRFEQGGVSAITRLRKDSPEPVGRSRA